ncbi:MAG: hypothetical protein EOO77_05320 [Oxalobacteraceae bacterium]|nr:MAG: hypothetical protein EOO77_05320 [Oxalobacteraceae bacterium]
MSARATAWREDLGAQIADMRVIADRQSKGIDADIARIDRHEAFDLAGEAVVERKASTGHAASLFRVRDKGARERYSREPTPHIVPAPDRARGKASAHDPATVMLCQFSLFYPSLRR